MQIIINFLAYLYEKVVALFSWAIDGIVYVLKAILWLVLDGALTAVYTLIQGIDFSVVVFQWAAAWADIPQSAIYLMVNIGFPQFVGIIAGAYTLRLALNLIPSWATRA